MAFQFAKAENINDENTVMRGGERGAEKKVGIGIVAMVHPESHLLCMWAGLASPTEPERYTPVRTRLTQANRFGQGANSQ
jgi:hypothetical protein